MSWESEDLTADYHSFEAEVFLAYGAKPVYGLHLID